MASKRAITYVIQFIFFFRSQEITQCIHHKGIMTADIMKIKNDSNEKSTNNNGFYKVIVIFILMLIFIG